MQPYIHIAMATKQCKKCKEEKPLTDYSKGQAKCKSCRKHLRVEKYDEQQKAIRKQHYNEIDKPKLELQKKIEREQLREEFRKKFDMKPGDKVLEIVFTTEKGLTITDYFMEEEAFYESLKEIEERVNRDIKDKENHVVAIAHSPPKEIKQKVIERNKDKDKYITGIYLIIVGNKAIPPFDMNITY